MLGVEGMGVKDALRLVSTDLEALLGVEIGEKDRARDWIAVEGEDVFGFGGKVVAAGGAGKDGEEVALW